MAAPVGLAPVWAVLLLLSNTLPAVPDMAAPPVASGVGSAAVPPAPLACWTSKYWPGCKSIAGKAVTAQVVPAAEAYCTLQLFTFTGLALRLKISMKSWVYNAPELPPPPYTWLMTRSEAARAGTDRLASTAAMTVRRSGVRKGENEVCMRIPVGK
ncbi:hypothetical protein D3C71_677630 [compost metagenome]